MKKNYLLLVLAMLWFVTVSYLLAHIGYHEIVAEMITDPRGTSTRLESILSVVFAVVSFVPSELLLSYPYVAGNYMTHRSLRAIVLATAIGIALYVPFSWYNFAVSF